MELLKIFKKCDFNKSLIQPFICFIYDIKLYYTTFDPETFLYKEIKVRFDLNVDWDEKNLARTAEYTLDHFTIL